MARDAAECLHGLVAAGEELPYEVREPGDGSPLCRYQPLTQHFVRDHAGELRSLDSFGAACAAIEAAGLAGTYLERMGVGVPPEPRRRAELAGVAFLCRLWSESTDFTLDDERLERAIEELQSTGEAEQGQIEVIVPLRGLQMPVARLDLPMASIVRADTVEVPADARSGDGLGASPWEPAFLAVVRVEEPDPDGEEGPDAGVAAVEAFRGLLTTLRLFKPGGVGIGPHAWTRVAGDRWRRIATAAGRLRPGGYRLVEGELGELVSFACTLAAPGTPFHRAAERRPGFPSTLARAITRFEAGLERNVVVEALNDHLLALRFLLEGRGPAGLGLPMRVAALCAEPDRRAEIKSVVDRAIGLERELWSGEPAPGAGSVTPAQTAAQLEDLARAILKDAAAGHLGSDLRATADEILLADGFAVGDGSGEQRGGTTEWDLDPIEAEGEAVAEAQAPTDPEPDRPELVDELDQILEEVSELDRRIIPQPSPEPEEEMVIARAREIFGGEAEHEAEPETKALEVLAEPAPAPPPAPPAREDERSDTNPVLRLIEQTRAESRAHHERAAGLFPRPETTEWTVREVAYDRTRRARAGN
jgi:hypothetical protein